MLPLLTATFPLKLISFYITEDDSDARKITTGDHTYSRQNDMTSIPYQTSSVSPKSAGRFLYRTNVFLSKVKIKH